MYRVLPLLNSSEVAECRRIAAETQFIDGRATVARFDGRVSMAGALARSRQ